MASKRKIKLLEKRRAAKRSRMTHERGNSRYAQKKQAQLRGVFAPESPFVPAQVWDRSMRMWVRNPEAAP